MKKDPPKAEKPKNAQNLKILREKLGLSQSQMALALGGIAQGSYKMWEFETRTPAKIREALFDAGVNLNWYDTGEGQMLRPGVIRIQIIRHEGNGKPIRLVPVMVDEPPPQTPPGQEPSLRDLLQKAEAIVLEIEADAKKPFRPDRRAELLTLVAEEVREAILEGTPDAAREKLLRWWKATGDAHPK